MGGGFEFYDTLRYILPGLILVFGFLYVVFPEEGQKFNLGEKIVIGVLAGFILHPIGLHQFVPGTRRIRNEQNAKSKKLLGTFEDIDLRYDLILITMNPDERAHFKKYFALGSFKLDFVIIILILMVCYVLKLVYYLIIENNVNVVNFILLIPFGIVIYTLRDDGLNDLRRSLNVVLFSIMRLKNDIDFCKKMEMIRSSSNFLKVERKLLNPERFPNLIRFFRA